MSAPTDAPPIVADLASSCAACGRPIDVRDRIGRVSYDAAGVPVRMECVLCALANPRRPG